MLIDDLIAGGAPASGTTIAPILERLRAAHKFAIAPDATAVADALANDYGGLTRAFAHCRIPFAETWLEFAHMDRPNFANAPVQAPHFQMRPHRVGYLLSALRNDLSAWKAHLFWSINDNQCSTAPMAMTFDMTRPLGGRLTLPTEEQNARRRLAQQQRGIVDVDQVDVHPGWKAGTDAQRLTMLQHTLPTTTDFPPPPPLGLITKQERDRFYEMVMDLAASDWAGEPSFLLALVGLLNARNAVETELVDQARLNRARVKRGRLPFFEHHVLRIARRQIVRIYGEAGARGNHAPMRGHFVRGHWKVRRTGIYFWHPHARGDFRRGRIDKDYELA